MRYASFRLQVWHSNRLGRIQWSARLEGLQDGHRMQFSSPDALLTHLRALLDPDQTTGMWPAEHGGTERP